MRTMASPLPALRLRGGGHGQVVQPAVIPDSALVEEMSRCNPQPVDIVTDYLEARQRGDLQTHVESLVCAQTSNESTPNPG